MASMSSMVRMASAAVVGNDAPSSIGGHEGLELEVVGGLAAEALLAGAERCRDLHPVPVLGAKGLKTEILPLSPMMSAWRRSTEDENMEQPMCALPAVGQREVGVHGAVDAGGGELGLGADHPGPGGQQPQQADGIAAHVHGGATGQRQLVADVTLLPQRGREGDVDLGDVAQLARADDLDEALGQRVVLVVECLHHDDTRVAVGRLRHGPGLVGVGGERLLAQDVLARPEGGNGPVAVQPVGEGVVDRVDLGILHQRGVAADHPRNTLLAGEFGRPLVVARRHRGDGHAPRPPGRLDQGGGGDAGRPQDPDSQHAAIIAECGSGVRRVGELRPRLTFPHYVRGGTPPGTVGPDAA